MFRLQTFLILLSVVTIGCAKTSVRDLAEKATTPQEDKIVQIVIDAIRINDPSKLEPILAEEAKSAELPQQIAAMAEYFPSAAIKSSVPVGHHRHDFFDSRGASKSRRVLVYQLDFEGGYFNYVTVTIDEKAPKLQVSGINVQDGPQLLDASRFQLSGKSTLHYIFLILSLVVVATVVSAAVLCFRLRPKRRWLWMAFILTPFVTFSLNWTSGDVSISYLNILFLGSSFVSSELQPPVVQFAIPIGALLFIFFKRPRLLQSERQI